MGWTDSADLAEYSDKIRREFLVPSSGWIGDLLIPLSGLTGIWDVLLLSALFVFSWITIRTSDHFVAIILARVFDTTIPLQHYLSTNPSVQSLHSRHCEQYWRIWYIATGIEGAAYFLFHPDLVTLVTCFKTAAMTILWLGRNADGSFWTSGMRYSPGTSARPEGGYGHPTQRPRTAAASLDTSAPPRTSRSSSRSQQPPSVERQQKWNKALEEKGYDRPARKEIIHELSSKPVNDRPEAFKTFVEPDESKRKDVNRKYSQKGKAREDREKKAKKAGEEERQRDKENKRKEVARRVGKGQPAGSGAAEEGGEVSERRAESLANGKYFQRPLGMSRENIPA